MIMVMVVIAITATVSYDAVLVQSVN